MERTLIGKIKENEGKSITIQGRITNIRQLGTISFLQIMDYSGMIQVVFEIVTDAKIGDIIEIKGDVVKDERSKSGYEIQGKEIIIISSSSEDHPFDIAKPEINLQLNTLLDHRTLSLRHPKVKSIFKLYDAVLESYETIMRKEGFTEIKTPKLLEAASEGGANFFKVNYFEKEAFLAQSPQLYKQILVGVFERVFEIGTVFRAEPHFTTRHINEYTSLDAEMGMINGYEDIMEMLNKVIKEMFEFIGQKAGDVLEMHKVELPVVPVKIPRVKLSEIRKIVKEKYDYVIPETTDIDPEGERLACRYAKEEFNSEFLFITNYFWKDKPFYTMPSKDNTEETDGFDLLFKGVEIVTGGQRIHDHKMLIENMEKKGVKPKGLEFYLNTFKFAMPPHGGWGLGSERLTQLILNLPTVKEAVLFPRDVKRLNP